MIACLRILFRFGLQDKLPLKFGKEIAFSAKFTGKRKKNVHSLLARILQHSLLSPKGPVQPIPMKLAYLPDETSFLLAQ